MTNDAKQEEKALRLYSIVELAQILGVPRSWLYSRSRTIPHLKLGRYLRYSLPQVIKWLKETEGMPVGGA